MYFALLFIFIYIIAVLSAYFLGYFAIHFVSKEVFKLAFEIKPNRKESENKTIRFPIQVIERVNEAITGKDVSFSNFVIQAVEYALDNMEE